MDKAVILARGLGTRMRQADSDAQLTQTQQKVADLGIKALIPIGRPFLDYVLSALADSGYRQVCLVIGPEHQAVRDYYASLKITRLSVEFAIQEKPLGTANAVSAVEPWTKGDPFLVLNSDNYYPAAALSPLRTLDGPGLAGFEMQALIEGSNIPADRIAKFAIIQTDDQDRVLRIIEKPDPALLATMKHPIFVSMNCWRFGESIFEACRRIPLSPRGEYELPIAVQYSLERLGQTYQVVPVKAPVLDLSSRGDIEAVASRMKGLEVRL